MHPKALQRRLAVEGTSFSEVIDCVPSGHRRPATRDTDIGLIHLTHQLGFAFDEPVLTGPVAGGSAGRPVPTGRVPYGCGRWWNPDQPAFATCSGRCQPPSSSDGWSLGRPSPGLSIQDERSFRGGQPVGPFLGTGFSRLYVQGPPRPSGSRSSGRQLWPGVPGRGGLSTKLTAGASASSFDSAAFDRRQLAPGQEVENVVTCDPSYWLDRRPVLRFGVDRVPGEVGAPVRLRRCRPQQVAAVPWLAQAWGEYSPAVG